MEREFMEEDQGIYSSNASKIFKINSQMDPTLMWYMRSGAAAGDGFTTPVSDASMYRSLLTHYQHSSSDGLGSLPSRGSPLSLVENLEVTPTPAVKVEEDVLVMDGIMVESMAGMKGMRSVSSDSSGSSSAAAASGNGLYKTEICRSWEDLASCRYGAKCQFAHGKEELRPLRYSMRTRPEGNVCKQFAVTGTCPYGPRCRFSHQLQSLLSTTQQTPSPSRPQHTAATTPTIKTATPTKTTADWSPMDDGIEVVLPGSSAEKPASRDEVNTYINSFLYGPTTPRRRLPVFEEICPSREATP
ncbi:hypothetical protein AAG906_024041 [Vitis piasezkii]